MPKYISLFFIIMCLLSTNVLALSCPNNGSQLMPGQSIATVLERCGKPISQDQYVDDTPISQELTYYKNQGLPTNAKVVFTFTNGQLININVTNTNSQNCQTTTITANGDQVFRTNSNCQTDNIDFNSTGACGEYLGVGATVSQVVNMCGTPVTTVNTQTSHVDVTELRYSNSVPGTLVFHGGALSGWQ